MPTISKMMIYALLLCTTMVFGQFPDPEDAYSTKVLETIEKNAKDFDSEDSEIRRRSVLVLSKYKTHPDARKVLLRALSDDEAKIRQAGIVSLVDGITDRPTALAVFPLLTDTSVSIRRICSAALPRMLLAIRTRTISSDGRIVPAPAIPKPIVDLLKKAHSDKDSTVRKNLVAIWAFIPRVIDFETFSKYLKDSDRDVRISALDKGRFIMPSRQFLGAIGGMVKDKDRSVRLRVAQTLGNYASIGNLKPLETLAKDADPTIRARALMGLMKAGRESAWTTLKKDIEKRRIKSSLAISAVELLPRLGAAGIAQLKAYLDSKDSAFRTAALQTLSVYQPQAISDKAVLAAIKSKSSDVRMAAGRLVTRRPQLAAASAKTFAESTHQDVRQLALSAVVFAPRKAAESILTDLFLDESTTIRTGALKRIGSMRFKGWRELMTDALEDTEQAIREQAVMSLLGAATYPLKATDPSLVPLKAYLKNGKDEKLKTFIRTRPIMSLSPLR